MLRQAIVEYGMPLCEAIEPTPEPRGREVLLRIRHCGACHSDLHLLDGHFDRVGGKSLAVRGGRANSTFSPALERLSAPPSWP